MSLQKARTAALLAGLVLVALALRGAGLGWPPLWADEAESALNALTIVEHGVPGDRHLGLPLFENTMVRPWPESTEYEFRDLSYSDRGLAVYHGWLPLYAIAAAFRLAGVTPDEAGRTTPPADASTRELVRWTRVPRWPSLAFSVLFVLFCFRLGQQVGGTDSAWSMALAAAVSNILVWLGRQARYYSATLALNAACGLAIWNAGRRGRFRDHALVGLGLGLLFHTHAIAAVSLGSVYAVVLLFSRRQPRLMPKAALAGGVSGLLVLPWAWWSGFFQQATKQPPARDLLDVVSLLQSLPSTDPFVLLTSGAGLAWLVTCAVLGPRIDDRWRRPFLDQLPAFSFAFMWLVVSYTGFVALVPAASYFVLRLRLAVAVPGLLLTTLVLTAATRALFPGRSGRAGPAAMAGLLLLSGQVQPRVPGPERESGGYEAVRLVRSWRLRPQARIFASPNDHLFLTYYTGLPVQSVSAVRRAWLERFEGDLVIVEGPWYESLSPEEVVGLARRHGVALTAAEAQGRAERLRWLPMLLDLEATVAEVVPLPPPLDELDRQLLDATREKTKGRMKALTRGTPLARAASLANWREFWQFFFLWFSEPDTRRRAQLNSAGRLARARAHVLPGGWVVYDCRPHREPPLVPAAGP